MSLRFLDPHEMNTILHAVQSFLTSREFAVNFFANLGGAMVGVFLAFAVERLRARRDVRTLYGRILQTARSELSYLRPMCDHMRDRLRDGGSAGIGDSFGIPANRALLINPVVHEHAPYSLIMAVTALCGYVGLPENAFQVGRSIKTKDVVQRELLNTTLADTVETASSLIKIALDQIDSELKLLGLQKRPDAATAEVSQRLREVLQSSDSSMTR